MNKYAMNAMQGYMDNFVDQTEFWYEKGGDNKCVNQVLKAAMAINAQVLVEMEIPEIYIESLPKAMLC
jgi:hypothetical protein